MQREILAQAGDAEDEGTAALMSDYIKEQEKVGLDAKSVFKLAHLLERAFIL